jgi:hypothetical protein
LYVTTAMAILVAQRTAPAHPTLPVR